MDCEVIRLEPFTWPGLAGSDRPEPWGPRLGRASPGRAATCTNPIMGGLTHFFSALFPNKVKQWILRCLTQLKPNLQTCIPLTGSRNHTNF